MAANSHHEQIEISFFEMINKTDDSLNGTNNKKRQHTSVTNIRNEHVFFTKDSKTAGPRLSHFKLSHDCIPF